MATDTSGTPLTGLSEVGDAMSGFLSDDLMVVDTGADQTDDQQTQDEAAPPAEKPTQAPKAPEQEDETSAEDDTADGDGDGSEDETSEQDAEQDDEEQEDADQAKPATITVKLDGKDVEVSVEEAAKGYQRQADYSRKTQALADDRRAFDALRTEHTREVEAVSQERGQYKVLLGQLQAALDQMAPKEPDWQELFARDKNEYLIARDNWRALQEQREAVKAEADRVAEVERGDQQKAQQQKIAAGFKRVIELVPEWKDVAVRHKDASATIEYAKNVLGYTEDEINASNDPRVVLAFYKAMKHDALKAEAANVRQQAVKKGQKVLKPGSAQTQVSTKQRSDKTAMKRLVKNGGRTEDAAGIMEGFLDL